MMSRIEGCSSPPSYVPLRNRNHCHGSTLIPYLQQNKREKPCKRSWESEKETPRSLLPSTPSLALSILSSKSREPGVYIATRVEGQRRPVINVCLRRDALRESLKKERRKKRRVKERRVKGSSKKSRRGSVPIPLCSFPEQINVAPRSPVLKF